MNKYWQTRYAIYKHGAEIGWVIKDETPGVDRLITAYIGLGIYDDVDIKTDTLKSVMMITDGLGMEIRADGDNV